MVGAQNVTGTDVGVGRQRLQIAQEVDLLLGFREAYEADVDIELQLPGKTLGVVGLGAIGVQVANGALAQGMNVIGFDPDITVKRAWEMSSQVRQAASIDELLANVDYVTFHVPLVDATRNMINAERLQRVRKNLIILNFSRDGVVNDAAVVDAINKGRVYAYICDFPSNLLKDHPRVVALPHLGASTQQAGPAGPAPGSRAGRRP